MSIRKIVKAKFTEPLNLLVAPEQLKWLTQKAQKETEGNISQIIRKLINDAIEEGLR